MASSLRRPGYLAVSSVNLFSKLRAYRPVRVSVFGMCCFNLHVQSGPPSHIRVGSCRPPSVRGQGASCSRVGASWPPLSSPLSAPVASSTAALTPGRFGTLQRARLERGALRNFSLSLRVEMQFTKLSGGFLLQGKSAL